MAIKTNLYNKAPLPFNGQKRNFLKFFRQIINQNINDDGDGWTIIDVFGGSGLLANNAKSLKPNARVIYNDFDGYATRLKNIDDTNRLRQQLANLLADLPKEARLSKDQKQEVIELIDNFNGFVDIHALSSWLLFSGQLVNHINDLHKKSFYNSIRCSDFALAEDYLDGLEIVSESFETLMPKFANTPKTLFLLDPPYLYTQQKSYKMKKYFAMIDFLKLMALTKPPYILFSSTKSEVLEYMEYLKQHKPKEWDRLGNFQLISINTAVNKDAKYEDNMICKFN